MANVAEDIFDTLGSLVGGRLYPGVVPANAAFPFAMYTLVSADPQQHLGGEAGLTQYRYQIDVFSPQKSVVDTLALQIRGAMNAAARFRSTCAMQQDDYDDDALLHRVILDFNVWKTQQV